MLQCNKEFAMNLQAQENILNAIKDSQGEGGVP
jgi:hypothetical protein